MGCDVTSEFGVRRGTERKLAWFVAISVVLHLVLTPVAGWLGLAALLFDRSTASSSEPPLEQLDAIPIELFEPAAPESEAPALPEEDPVALIDEWVEQPPPPPPASTRRPRPNEEAKKEKKPGATPPVDAGAPENRAQVAERGSNPASKSRAAADLQPDAGRKVEAQRPKRRRIENPVSLAGKAGDITKSNASVGLILYADRVRHHRVGKRIGQMLPQLPQWDDFFEGGQLNPVRDFDRLFMAGPSFYHSSELVIALTYNTEQRAVRQAIDRLVRREGRWLKEAPMPAAIARADRAERLITMPGPKTVMVVPPRLRDQAFRSRGLSIPDPKGPEALVAFTVQPSKALARFGLNIPKSVAQASLRLTPLPNGGALIEVSADDASPEQARATAAAVERDLNGVIELISGVSNVLSRFGFGALTQGARLPKIELQPRGKQIWGQVRLDSQQVNFILDRIERQLLLATRRSAPPSGSTGGPKAPSPRPQTAPAKRPSAKDSLPGARPQPGPRQLGESGSSGR